MIAGGVAVVEKVGLLAVAVAGTWLSASAVAARWGVQWSCLRHRPSDRFRGGGMVLFGLGQSWAQSHESATPSVGGHADTELAVI